MGAKNSKTQSQAGLKRTKAIEKRAMAIIQSSKKRWRLTTGVEITDAQIIRLQELRSQRLAMNALRSRLDYLLASRDALTEMPAHNPAEKARMIREVQDDIDRIRQEERELQTLMEGLGL